MKVVNTAIRSLKELYDKIEKKNLIIPAHQRADVWNSTQKINWIKLVNVKGQLPGIITSYILEGEQEGHVPWRLNDGAQRVYYSLLDFVSDCKAKGQDWQSILGECDINEQRVSYKDEHEAIDYFNKINSSGTICTPYELAKTEFVKELENFDTVWKPLFESIDKIIADALAKLGCETEDVKKNRLTTHKRLRDNYALFLRFITEDKTQKTYTSLGSNFIKPTDYSKQVECETNLAKHLNKIGKGEAVEKLKKFQNFIETYSAFYHQHFNLAFKGTKFPANVHVRWWFNLAIYAKNMNADMDIFRKFTKKLIEKTEGRTSIFYEAENGQTNNCTTAMSNLSTLSTVIRAIGGSEYDFRNVESRKSYNIPMPPGYHVSHIDSFRNHGNGNVVVENALDNLRRGSKDMTKEDAAILRPN